MINLNSFPKDLTIISNTCIGVRLYHDYHQKFLSPTIEFYMEPDSFVNFCLNLEYYLYYHLIIYLLKDLNLLILGNLLK